MNININVADYLSQDEIKEECKYAIRNSVNEMFKRDNDVNRLITNLTIKMLHEAIENNKSLMEQRVRDEIMRHDLYEIQEVMYNIACDVLYNRIFAKEN